MVKESPPLDAGIRPAHEPLLASRMKTSRASVDRMHDSSKPSLTVGSLGNSTAARLECGIVLCSCLMLVRELRTDLLRLTVGTILVSESP